MKITAVSKDLGICEHYSGQQFLVRRDAAGQVTFTPIDAIAQQRQSPQVTSAPAPIPQAARTPSQQDPLAILLVGLGVILLIAIGGYFLGFVAGKNGQSVVVVPRAPVCDTHRSSFLFWNSERKECQ